MADGAATTLGAVGPPGTLSTLGHLIDGRIVRDGVTFPVHCPSTGEVIGHCPGAGDDLLERAVAAAERALPGWAARPVSERQEVIRAMGGALTEHMAQLVSISELEGLAGAMVGYARPSSWTTSRTPTCQLT